MGCSQSSFKNKKRHDSKATDEESSSDDRCNRKGKHSKKKTSVSSTRRAFDGLLTSPTANSSEERHNDKQSGASKPEYGTVDELYPPLKALEKKPGTEETDGGHLPNGYAMDSRPRGPVFILNNFVAGTQCRLGSNLDVSRLDAAFKGLHFVVQPIERNLTAENMKKCCEDWAKLANRDFSKADCLVVVIMAHGIRLGHLLDADSRKLVKLADLISPFHGDKSPTLIGKPKIFIVQACRGNKTCVAVCDPGAREMSTPPSSGYQIERSGDDICVAAVNSDERFEDNGNSGLLPRNADTLVAFSSSEGEKSFRSERDGSPYIRELTEVLKRTEVAGEKRRFLDIITEVQGRVSNLIGEDENGERVVQMPEFTSTLRGPIYL